MEDLKDLKGLSFADGDPFPCLRNPEPDADDLAEDDDGGFEEDWGFDLERELSNLRVASAVHPAPVDAAGKELADYDVHPQHRRDGKESLPSFTSSISGSYRSNFITPQVIGSLPKGLTAMERAGRGLAVSPAAQRLSELAGPGANGHSAAGSKLRRSALKGSVVAFITAGYSGKRFVFERAQELGVRSIILDGPDSWSQVLVADGLVERFVPIDFAEAGTVLERCFDVLSKLRDEIGLDGVTTFNEFAVPLVARLAERLWLPGNPPSACDMARDKAATRRIMAEAKLPSPKHAMIHGPEDVDAAAATVGFPAVIKPIAAAASQGVVRVDSLEELRSKVKETQEELGKLYLDADGHLCKAEPGEQVDAQARAQVSQFVSSTLMMEEYLDGDEVDCDLVISEGEVTYGAVTDNWPTIEPYFNETGSNCPSILAVETQRELLDLAVASVKVLGFTLGVFHVELKATSRGPRLIEVNARMGGGGVRDINRVVWGVDLVDQHLLASVGLPARPLIAKRPLRRIAEYSINAPLTGVLEDDSFMAPWQDLPGTIYARPLVAPGTKVVSVKDGMPDWLCEICVSRPTVREAIAFVKQVELEIKFPIKPAA